MSEPAVPFLRVVSAADVLAEVEAEREACLAAVRDGYLAHADGSSVVPHSSFLRFPDRERDRIIALPAYLGGRFDVAGLKWIASFPDNTYAGIPRASAVLLLNDRTTGFPFACIEASIISATRTAASAVLAAEALLGKRQTGTVGFIGNGVIADHVRRFLRDLRWDIGSLRLFDTNPSAAQGFAAAAERDGQGRVDIATSGDEVFTESDVVVLATVEGEPHIHDPTLLRHNPVVLHLSLRDLAPELIIGSFNITDDIEHAVRENTSLHLAEQRVGNRKFIDGTIADLLDKDVLRPATKPAVFSPFGLGALDLAVGSWVYDRITRREGGHCVRDFFPDTQPR